MKWFVDVYYLMTDDKENTEHSYEWRQTQIMTKNMRDRTVTACVDTDRQQMVTDV